MSEHQNDTRWDCVALGEVMLRLDPGSERVRTARSFRASEGGGEYNVARAAAKVFGLRSTIVTALVDNEVGRLVETLVSAGGVSVEHVRWEPFDGLGFTRVGLNFTERGSGIRPPLGLSDRANSAASKLVVGNIDWTAILDVERSRWLHTGGIFAGLSESCSEVAEEAMRAAKGAGTLISYDMNIRKSLWQRQGKDPVAVTRRLVAQADALFGSLEDYRSALGLEFEDCPAAIWADEPSRFAAVAEAAHAAFNGLSVVGMTLRNAHTANRTDWGGLLWVDGTVYSGRFHRDLEIYDRVGGGDGFVAGVMCSLLSGGAPAEAVEWGVAHGALAMTTPGDTSMATLDEVRRAVDARDARVER
jgi:2-dehydro-3-deoxygluconokinase